MSVLFARSLFAFLFFLTMTSGSSCLAEDRQLAPPGPTDGPGIWANVWNYPTGDLDTYCSTLTSHAVKNLYIQTTRTNMPPIAHAPELGQLLDACHKHGIRVIGWAYLELSSPSADADKMIAAARFQSPHGQSLDAIAPDLEKNLTAQRVEQFSTLLRKSLGASYPLIAVVYSPLNHYREVNSIPWKTLAKFYDVIAPMAYWNGKSHKFDAYDYTLSTVRTIRQQCGRPDIEIHVIGDGMGTNSSDILGFLRACRESEATSASIYPNQRPTSEQLACLTHYQDYFEPNARFRLAAFRQMINSGAVGSTDNLDPTQSISRADFYRMLSHHLHAIVPSQMSTGSEAPIYPSEALALLAQLVEASPNNHGVQPKRADRWFAAPVMAEAQHSRSAESRPLNWLDASVMLLQASSETR